MPDGQDIFNHKMRRIVYNYVSSNPGVSFGTIKRIMDMNKSTLRYHLNFLEKAEKVKCIREGKHNCYYPSETDTLNHSPIPGVDLNTLTKGQRRLLTLTIKEPGITPEELLNSLPENKKKLKYNLNRLVELRLIWKVKIEGEIGYEHITPEDVKEEILKKLIKRLLAKEIDEETFIAIKKRLEETD